MELNTTYFYTATILNWYSLLKYDEFKNVIIQSLAFLVLKQKVRVYGFVVMPNHIHLIWQNLERNGKEMPNESFLKFIGHQFKKTLNKNGLLDEKFLVNKTDRIYQFWQRSSLAIEIMSKEMLEQKLNYIHLNPLQRHWNLTSDANKYEYSSCSFYEKNDVRYPWLTDYRTDFN